MSDKSHKKNIIFVWVFRILYDVWEPKKWRPRNHLSMYIKGFIFTGTVSKLRTLKYFNWLKLTRVRVKVLIFYNILNIIKNMLLNDGLTEPSTLFVLKQRWFTHIIHVFVPFSFLKCSLGFIYYHEMNIFYQFLCYFLSMLFFLLSKLSSQLPFMSHIHSS